MRREGQRAAPNERGRPLEDLNRIAVMVGIVAGAMKIFGYLVTAGTAVWYWFRPGKKAEAKAKQ